MMRFALNAILSYFTAVCNPKDLGASGQSVPEAPIEAIL